MRPHLALCDHSRLVYTDRMPRRRTRLTLGGRIAECRIRRGVSQREAARRAGVNEKTWRDWESDKRTPEDWNHPVIEDFCGWAPGSVEAVLADRAPTPRDLATVTELHPGIAHSPPDDEFVRELREMFKPRPVPQDLIDAYWAEKADDDTRRQRRFLDEAARKVREASG